MIVLPTIAPSILAADHINLQSFITQCIKQSANNLWLHCDIMDGHFVPNLSFGPQTVKAIRNKFEFIFLDIHLMIEQPELYIDAFIKAGSNLISFHIETTNVFQAIQKCKKWNTKIGICINPHTDICVLEPILNQVDMVTVMSVNPGFGGQTFIQSSYEKIQWLTKYRKKKQLSYLIQVDGGVTRCHINALKTSGVDIIVIGSGIFNSKCEIILNKVMTILYS